MTLKPRLYGFIQNGGDPITLGNILKKNGVASQFNQYCLRFSGQHLHKWEYLEDGKYEIVIECDTIEEFLGIAAQVMKSAILAKAGYFMEICDSSGSIIKEFKSETR